MAERFNRCILRAENSAHFWREGWQLQGSFTQSFLLQFWKSQCPSGSKYSEFSKTPPAFAFWMSLKVVVAIFPRNDIFFWDTLYLKLTFALFQSIRITCFCNNLPIYSISLPYPSISERFCPFCSLILPHSGCHARFCATDLNSLLILWLV